MPCSQRQLDLNAGHVRQVGCFRSGAAEITQFKAFDQFGELLWRSAGQAPVGLDGSAKSVETIWSGRSTQIVAHVIDGVVSVYITLKADLLRSGEDQSLGNQVLACPWLQQIL